MDTLSIYLLVYLIVAVLSYFCIKRMIEDEEERFKEQLPSVEPAALAKYVSLIPGLNLLLLLMIAPIIIRDWFVSLTASRAPSPEAIKAVNELTAFLKSQETPAHRVVTEMEKEELDIVVIIAIDHKSKKLASGLTQPLPEHVLIAMMEDMATNLKAGQYSAKEPAQSNP